MSNKRSNIDVPSLILDLVERFERNLSSYRSLGYNEAQVRREFIEPFFEKLGWDVSNRAGYAEAYKDVIFEDAIKVGGATKAPDYCFRIGGARKFFLEAKKPAIDLKGNISPAYQLRRYAWSAKLPLSILTDFEEFAVYDCRIRPKPTDRPSIDRIFYLSYKDYPTRWNEIAEIFSKESVLKGSFDRFAETTKGKKGTSPVDVEFLKEIEQWRNALARNIALRNPTLSVRELNFAVQRTIDRIIFLRMCEDRGIETYGQLQALLNGTKTYARLNYLYGLADDKYNSGLFHFRAERDRAEPPDDLTPALIIDDKVLKEIIRFLYYPESPYEFSVLGSDILGNVYEQFLGKVIRLTPKHQAKVEDKPEVKKAGGVYYTPTYIVNYIVENTLGKLCNGKNPKQIVNLRILDPACGSGSFLIGAYSYLLDYHRDWYVEHFLPSRDFRGKIPARALRSLVPGPRPQIPIYQGPGGQWWLTTQEKKRILLNNIYGVDIDSQAVEVTKLNLLLKVLEGESQDTLESQQKLWRERALPDLGDNIKCGNSLIGPDFYDNQQMSLLAEEERYRINVFDWETEFPEIIKAGGFDAVIGNPPYVRIQALREWAPTEVEFYKQHYYSASIGNYDIYVVFVERALQLLNDRGRMGYILPHKFFNAKYGEPLREILSKGRHISKIIHFGAQQIFSGASTYTCLLFLDKAICNQFEFARVDNLTAWRTNAEATEGKFDAGETLASEWNFIVGKGSDLFEELNKMPVTLGDISKIFQGLVTGADRVFVFENPHNIEPQVLHRFLKPSSIPPYGFPQTSYWMLFPYYLQNKKATLISQGDFEDKFPNAWAHLKSHEKALRSREKGKWNHEKWYAFGRSQNLTQMEEPKLIIQVLALRPTVIYDDRKLYMTGGGGGPFYGIRSLDETISLPYLLGILNSRLFGAIVFAKSTQMRGGYFRFSKQYIESTPIPVLDLTSVSDKAHHDRMVELVEQMLELHKRLAVAKTPDEKTRLQRQIDATDQQIDRLVYELYGLTEEEIKIVEEATQ